MNGAGPAGALGLSSPWMLAAGAAAAAAVLVLHLVRPRPRRQPVSSLLLWQLLQEQLREQSLLRRLIQSLPLWLQVAACLLMGLALARPVWRGGTPGVTAIFVADRSFSMKAREDGADRFAQALDRLEQVLRQQASRGVPRIYVGAVGPEGAALAGAFRSADAASQALRALERPADGAADFHALAREVAAVASGGGDVRVWLATDGVMGDQAAEGLRELARLAHLEVLWVGRPGAPNVAVTALEAYGAGSEPGDVELMAEVANFSPETVEGVLRLQGDFGLDEARALRLDPQGRARVVVPYRVLGPGAVRARLERSAGDALPDDDERALAFSDPRQGAVAYLVGEPSEALRRALEAAGPLRVVWVPAVPVTPRAAGPSPLPGSTGGTGSGPPVRLVVFNGVRPPEAPEQGAAPGPWQAPVWWVLPPAGGAPAEAPAAGGGGAGEAVVYWRRTHPLLRFVDLDGVRVRRSPLAEAVPSGAEVLVEGSGGPLMWEYRDAGGRMVIETAFAVEQSDLPHRVAFAVLAANVVRAAAPDAWNPAQPPVPAGRAVSIPVPPGEERVLVLHPSGDVTEVDPSGRLQVAFDDTSRAGVYWAWGASGASAQPLAVWAVQPPGPEESDLRRTHPVASALAEPVEAASPASRPEPLWRAGVAAALGILAAEAGLYLAATRMPGRMARRLAGETSGGAAAGVWLRRRRSFAVLRAAGTAALALALLDPRLAWPSAGRSVVFVLDVSRSIPAAARALAAAFVEAAVSGLGPADRAWVIEAAERPRLVAAYRGGRPDPEAPPPPSVGARGDATDLEAALRAALSLPGAGTGSPEEGSEQELPDRIVLVSDGRQTRGDALAAARQGTVPVDVVAVLARPDPEVALGPLGGPTWVPAGSPVVLRLRAYASVPQAAQLVITRDGVPVWRQAVELQAGWNTFSFQDRAGPGGSSAAYTARIEAALDTYPANNRADLVVAAAGEPRVLYVTENGAGAPLAALGAAGIPAEAASPEQLPATRGGLTRFSAVILDDVPATRLTRPQMEALAASVRDAGIGLVVLGGPHAFGPGGYAATPLEEVLPVWARVPSRLLLPQVALVLVIDKSGSMGEREPAGTKLDAARRAAAATLELLAPGDLVGVLAFDTEPRWVYPLGPASDPVEVMRRMARLGADGGTSLGPALQEALDSLRRARAMVRHAIVLSDGKSNPADFQAITLAAAQEGITVSTVAIGPDADAGLLADIARWGRGRSYLTTDLRTIPQIFASETATVSRSAIVQGTVEVAPSAGPAQGLLPEVEQWPPLSGYVAVTPKAAASVYLASREGDPLLAAWRAGLGRVVAFTSSLTGAWSQAWQRSGLAADLLERAVRWAMAPAGGAPGASRLYLELEGDRARVVAEALDAAGRPVNFLEPRATVSGPSGRATELALAQEAPGRYVAELQAPEPGEYVATADLGGERLRAVAVRSYPAELAPGPPSPVLLDELARSTGGQVLGYIVPGAGEDAAERSLPRELQEAASRLAHLAPRAASPARARPAWPFLVGAALAFLVTDVAARRIDRPAAAIVAGLRWIPGALTAAVRSRLARWRHPAPEELLRRKRRPKPARAGSPTPVEPGVDPTRAARLYLARLRRERRSR